MMTIQITDVATETEVLAYIEARNASRTTIANGVVPNAKKALVEYDWLVTALEGGDESAGMPDMSIFVDYHNGVVADVAPFITLLQRCMEVLVMTPALINQGARAQGKVAPFGEGITDTVDPTEYGALLSGTVAAIQAVAVALGGE